MIKDVLKISKELLYDKPFYGSILLSLNKQVSDTKTKTAGVGLEGIMYKLLVNPTFWSSLSDDHKQGLLIHELGHIINFHLTEYNHLTDKEVANIAMDLYINQTIPEKLLPEGGCTIDKFEGMEPNKDTNWYYNKLMENKKANNDKTLSNALDAMKNGDSQSQDSNGNPMNLPDHDWEEIENSSEAIKKMLGKNTEELLRNVVRQLSNQPGTIPNGLESLLDKLAKIEPPKFNWKAYLRRFVGTSTKTWVNKTRRKQSKRFQGMPGSREFYFSNILVAIDTSASVNDDDIIEFQKELVHMHKTGHDIYIIEVDTKLQKQFKFNPKKPLEIKGRGGTDFQPAIDFFNDNFKKFSCLIYLTDGEAYIPENAKGNILWVHGTNHDVNESLPGKCIKLTY